MTAGDSGKVFFILKKESHRWSAFVDIRCLDLTSRTLRPSYNHEGSQSGAILTQKELLNSMRERTWVLGAISGS